MTISPSKDCWSRYDIDANFRVLAEWLGPDFLRAMTFPELQWLSGAQEYRASGKFRIVAWLTRVNRGGSRLDLLGPPLTGCSQFVLMAHRSVRRECLPMFAKNPRPRPQPWLKRRSPKPLPAVEAMCVRLCARRTRTWRPKSND